MANGKIRFGKHSGGELALVFPDGVDNTEVVFPESGILAKTSDINTAGVELKTIASGTATFTATTNNINLTGIGIGVEIGDVIKIAGSTNNDSEFTIEVITDDNNIIVNQAHANNSLTYSNGKRTKTLASETSNITVKLLAKYYNALLGLGQDWVSVSPIRNKDANYQNLTNRLIKASISAGEGVGFSFRCFVDDKFIGDTVNVYTGVTIPCVFDIPNKSIYRASTNTGTPGASIWLELR